MSMIKTVSLELIVTLFIQWNIKGELRRIVLVALFHTMAWN